MRPIRTQVHRDPTGVYLCIYFTDVTPEDHYCSIKVDVTNDHISLQEKTYGQQFSLRRDAFAALSALIQEELDRRG